MFTKDGKLKFWQAQKLVLMGTASTCLCLGIYRDGLETFITNLRLPYDKFSKMFNGDKTKVGVDGHSEHLSLLGNL